MPPPEGKISPARNARNKWIAELNSWRREFSHQTDSALHLISSLCKNGAPVESFLDFTIEELAHLAYHKELVSIPAY